MDSPKQRPTPLAFSRSHALRHRGECGQRTACWRPECREHFGTYATVEVLRDGRTFAFCHGSESDRPWAMAT